GDVGILKQVVSARRALKAGTEHEHPHGPWFSWSIEANLWRAMKINSLQPVPQTGMYFASPVPPLTL
ncbi:MAG: hypothetical protein ACREND_18145, partial [Gemmatimonadaceae bacterium]